MCAANATELGSHWTDFVTPRASKCDHAAMQHAGRLKCLTFMPLRHEGKISTLSQKPRLRLQCAMMSDTMGGAFANARIDMGVNHQTIRTA